MRLRNIFRRKKKQSTKVQSFPTSKKVRGVKADLIIVDDITPEEKQAKWDRHKPISSQREQDRLDMMKQDEEIFSWPIIIKGQCMGFLKSGVQCSRVVNTVYCWQHRDKINRS